jgi:hypothetical protein
MKKMIFLLGLITASYAALPPLYQSTREIQAILTDSQLTSKLGSAESILQILKIDGGYLVSTTQHTIKVDVVYKRLEDRKVGPAQFELNFQDPHKIAAVEEEGIY